MSEAIPEVTPELIPVVAAVIEEIGRFLLAKRPAGKRHAGKWEFPGGKIERGETELEAVRRELAEELGVQVVAVGPSELSVADRNSTFAISFIPTTIQGTPEAREHSALAWIPLEEMTTYDLAESDRKYVEYRLALKSVTRE